MKRYLRIGGSLAVSIVCIALSACSSESAKPPANNDSPSLSERLQVVVDDAVESGLPGVSLHVQKRGQNTSVVSGVVNQFTAEPVTPSTLFHAASVGKTFTATLLMRLVEMNYLQLEDSIDGLLDPSMSSMIPHADKITLEMLLAHTSGIQDYYDNPKFVADFIESSGKIWSPIELIDFISHTETNFQPGTQYGYSNTNYVLLGVIAERVTGVPIGMALRQWVFQPAGLENSFGVFEELGQPKTARGYVPFSLFEGSGLDLTPEFDIDTTELLNSEGLGDASIHSNPGDLNSFIRTLIDTNTLVPEQLKAKMLEESIPGVSEHGLGLYVSKEDGSTYGATGKGFGVHSAMIYFPSKDVSFSTIANGSYGEYDELFDQYTRQLTKVLFDKE